MYLVIFDIYARLDSLDLPGESREIRYSKGTGKIGCDAYEPLHRDIYIYYEKKQLKLVISQLTNLYYSSIEISKISTLSLNFLSKTQCLVEPTSQLF